ncbi:hypothetical protein J1605_023369 [Eschrichtius robustus]|uniref:ENTH domain-containing protein n=1 Tax=Eschrichtius robustus TaxID=9764 RepID=A0AB34H5X8_ESCRO|nr:hypothetical protein J1605_023369 [Eschrichtius robustus]
MGSSASKAALRATTDEPSEPGPKHLADLIQYINGTNRSVKHLADILSEKTRSSSWVVVFKALITVHHLMVHGNERFIQHLASRNSLFTLYNFLDKSVIEGYTMSTFIRRYSRYLNEKSLAYRLIAYDITKTKRGTDGVMRTMNTKELLDTLAVIQTQFDALLYFNANPDEITNGIIHAAFMLLFKDLLRLFAAYNEGILNLLGKYFDMRKNQCKESLGIYIRFLERTTKLAQFLKVAEQVGIDQNDIPYLNQCLTVVWQTCLGWDWRNGEKSVKRERVMMWGEEIERIWDPEHGASSSGLRAVQTYVSGPHPSSELQGHKLGDLPDGSALLGTSFALA